MLKLFAKHAKRSPFAFNFCSQNQEQPEIKEQIIKASLLYVNQLGWNEKAINAGLADLDLSSASHGVLPNGEYDMVLHIMKDWHAKTIDELKFHENFEDLKIREKIYLAIKLRLKKQIPYINRWNEAMAVGALPMHAKTTSEQLWKFADDIWFLAGDRSGFTDPNYYSKRSLLLSVYITTELYMLTDQSAEFEETWKFLERRIEDVLSVGKYTNTVKVGVNSIFKGLEDTLTMFNIPKESPFDINKIKDMIFNQNKQQEQQDQAKYEQYAQESQNEEEEKKNENDENKEENQKNNTNEESKK